MTSLFRNQAAGFAFLDLYAALCREYGEPETFSAPRALGSDDTAGTHIPDTTPSLPIGGTP